MTTYPLAPTGGATDVVFHQGFVYCAWQTGRQVEVGVYTVAGARVAGALFPCSDGAFPRLVSAYGAWWLILRGPDDHAVLYRDALEVWRSPTVAGGNNPVCCWTQAFAWMRVGDNVIFVADLLTPAVQTSQPPTTGEGLSHFNETGRVVGVTEARGMVPGMTRPCWAGDHLVCGEHPAGGALVRAGDGRECVIWAGTDTYVPRMAASPEGLYAVTTHGRDGVRLALLTDADLVHPQPIPPESWDAPGTTVDCLPFFAMFGSTVPRTSADQQVWQAHAREHGLIDIVKGALPHIVERLDLGHGDEDVRLVYDNSDGRSPQAWRLDVTGDGLSGGVWCRANGKVGDREVFSQARLIRRSAVPGGASTSEAFGYAVGIAQHGRHIDYGGDVGVVDRVLVTRFEPHAGQTQDAYHERHHWMIQRGQPLGLVRYEEVRHGVVTRSFTFNRFDPSQHVEPSALILYPIPDPPATEPDPMPTIIPREQFSAAFSATNAFYAAEAGLQRPGGMVIDVDGVLSADVLAMQQWGYDLASGVPTSTVFAQIRQSDEWQTKHANDPQPEPGPAPLRGTVRIAADGHAYTDDNGDTLPVGAHGGDLLSRWARGQRAEVRAIVESFLAAGHGFTRTWSYLRGSYWDGYEFALTYDVLASFCAMLREYGMKLLLSQGDLFQGGVSSATQRDVQRIVLEVMRDYRDVFVGVDPCNEPCNNSDATPEELAEWIAPIVRAYKDLPASLGSIVEAANEAAHKQRRKDYCIPPATVFDHHISGPSGESLIGRHWTEGYESPLWLHVASEPRGDGPLVTDPKVSDTNILCLMAVASVMAGGMYVWFSSPGVKSDKGERFENKAGFTEVPRLIAELPRDLHRWERFHGGNRFKGKRVYAVPDGVNARAEHALASDGRFLALLHTGPWTSCYAERPHRIEWQRDFGDKGRVIMGRVE